MTFYDLESWALVLWLNTRADINQAKGCNEAARQLRALALMEQARAIGLRSRRDV